MGRGERRENVVSNQCSFCGTNLAEFPDHIDICPECGGRLHVGEDAATCENCDFAAFESYEEGVPKDHYLLIS